MYSLALLTLLVPSLAVPIGNQNVSWTTSSSTGSPIEVSIEVSIVAPPTATARGRLTLPPPKLPVGFAPEDHPFILPASASVLPNGKMGFRSRPPMPPGSLFPDNIAAATIPLPPAEIGPLQLPAPGILSTLNETREGCEWVQLVCEKVYSTDGIDPEDLAEAESFCKSASNCWEAEYQGDPDADSDHDQEMKTDDGAEYDQEEDARGDFEADQAEDAAEGAVENVKRDYVGPSPNPTPPLEFDFVNEMPDLLGNGEMPNISHGIEITSRYCNSVIDDCNRSIELIDRYWPLGTFPKVAKLCRQRDQCLYWERSNTEYEVRKLLEETKQEFVDDERLDNEQFANEQFDDEDFVEEDLDEEEVDEEDLDDEDLDAEQFDESPSPPENAEALPSTKQKRGSVETLHSILEYLVNASDEMDEPHCETFRDDCFDGNRLVASHGWMMKDFPHIRPMCWRAVECYERAKGREQNMSGIWQLESLRDELQYMTVREPEPEIRMGLGDVDLDKILAPADPSLLKPGKPLDNRHEQIDTTFFSVGADEYDRSLRLAGEN